MNIIFQIDNGVFENKYQHNGEVSALFQIATTNNTDGYRIKLPITTNTKY